MNYESVLQKRAAVKQSESAGEVADSMDVRMALMARVHSGEITLEHAQAQLKKIKAGAKKAGMTTRARAFREA